MSIGKCKCMFSVVAATVRWYYFLIIIFLHTLLLLLQLIAIILMEKNICDQDDMLNAKISNYNGKKQFIFLAGW